MKTKIFCPGFKIKFENVLLDLKIDGNPPIFQPKRNYIFSV
jgi:hypothetical protein